MDILIDCGASNGSAIGEIDRQFGPFERIFAFEPNPGNASSIPRGDPRLVVIEEAVSTKNGSARFYLSEQFDGSTLYPEKISGNIDKNRYIDVQTVDFADWLDKTVAPQDKVVCKMDIEGAEFDVLEHLLKRKKARLIDLLLVEWHVSRFPDRWPRRWRRTLIKIRLLLSGTGYRNWR